MKKLLVYILISSSILTNSSSFATTEKPSVKIDGKFDFRAAGLQQSDLDETKKKLSANTSGAVFTSSASVSVTAECIADSGLKYGVVLGLTPLSFKSKSNPSFIFLEGALGKLELGSGKSAMTQMVIDADGASLGMGSKWDTYAKLDPEGYNIQYMTSFDSALDFNLRNSAAVDFSRKISYFTPKFSGFQFGLSYIPDSANSGADKQSADAKHTRSYGIDGQAWLNDEMAAAKANGTNFTDTTSNLVIDVKHAFSFGAQHQHAWNEDLSTKLAVVFEYGKTVNNPKDGNPIEAKHLLSDIKSYKIGFNIAYRELDFTASYGNGLNRFTSEFQDGKRTSSNAYDACLKYSKDKSSLSITYFNSDNKGNKISAVSLATEYAFLPGLTPYFQVTKFNASGYYKESATAAEKRDERNGWVFALGTRLKF